MSSIIFSDKYQKKMLSVAVVVSILRVEYESQNQTTELMTSYT